MSSVSHPVLVVTGIGENISLHCQCPMSVSVHHQGEFKPHTSFQDLLKEGVCAPSSDEYQIYQALLPNRPCPSGLSAWELWVPLQPLP